MEVAVPCVVLAYDAITRRFFEPSLHCHLEGPIRRVVSAITEWKAIAG